MYEHPYYGYEEAARALAERIKAEATTTSDLHSLAEAATALANLCTAITSR